MKQVPLLMLTILMFFCEGGSDGGSSNPTDPVDSSGFITPADETQMELSDAYETDLSEITNIVVSQQSIGQDFAQLLENRNIIIDEDTVVQLIEISKYPCPDDLCRGDLSDSESLGIGKNVLTTGELSPSVVRNQAERGTCVAFAMSEAVEELLERWASLSV
jgi:hypothetical protein